MQKWARLLYQPGVPLYGDTRITGSRQHIAVSRKAAEEGMVLLKNNGTLPLSVDKPLALIGKACVDYVKGGGGSGDVFCKYIHSLYDGLKAQNVKVYEPLIQYYRDEIDKQYADGMSPGMTREVLIPKELLDGARAFSDTAVVVINRFSGEGWDRSDVECNNEYNPWPGETSMPKISGKIFPDGDFYLTKEEKEMIEAATTNFSKVVAVLNIGGVIDLRWAKEDARIDSVLLMGQGGMEGGDAAADILLGKVNPSGRLSDTFAGTLEDYPSTEGFHESFDYVDYNEDIYVGYRYFETIPGADKKVVYPFGYGLSYTSFETKVLGTSNSNGEIVFKKGRGRNELSYRIIDADKNEVELINLVSDKCKTITISSTVWYDGEKYTVTKIGKDTFRNKALLKSITINGNKLSSIGENAFLDIAENSKVTIIAKNKTIYSNVVNMINDSNIGSIIYKYKKG